MRKFISMMALTIFILSIVTSCKPRERCPAYGHQTTKQAHRPA
jgi:hypothetical protein